jgi:hypothetical protein
LYNRDLFLYCVFCNLVHFWRFLAIKNFFSQENKGQRDEGEEKDECLTKGVF